jgi:serine/threonine protein kinase
LAIKKLPAKNLNNQAIASLKLEAEFMKKLSHPRIVSCFGIVESEENYCMVMELCINGSLSDYMAANPSPTIDWEKKSDFAVDIAAGMNYLHKLGVIHRDLKLGNVVLDKHDRPKITDFGLSVVKSSTQTSMKLNETGTPQYMAPESFGIVPIFSTKTDVYAFAVVLWELG